MKILITGGTGLLGQYLLPHLVNCGHKVTVVTRNPLKAKYNLDPCIKVWRNFENASNLNNYDAVINLAGEPIANKRWSQKQKENLCQSRWDITQQLTDLFKISSSPPEVFVSGSAIGYYGEMGEVTVSECSEVKKNDQFTHKLCARWEEIAQKAQSSRTRVCLLRTGLILTPHGGFLERLIFLFQMGLGGPSGNGLQYFSWIHIEDMVNGICWLLTNSLNGPFNMVSPYPVRNKQFSDTLGKVINRPTLFRQPAVLLKLLLGEASELLLNSVRALPNNLEDSGFKIRWPYLEEALSDIVLKRSASI